MITDIHLADKLSQVIDCEEVKPGRSLNADNGLRGLPVTILLIRKGSLLIIRARPAGHRPLVRHSLILRTR